MEQCYLEPTQEAGAELFRRGITGPIVMLNLLRLRETADYSAYPELAPAQPVSGREALQRYIDHTLPYLRDSGGEIVMLGAGGRYFIGPAAEQWDIAMLIRQHSLASFFAFAGDSGYLAGLGHRNAAVSDSRLLPLEEFPGTAITAPG